MTILLLRPYATFAQGATVDLDNATEASLVSQGLARYTSNPGPFFEPFTAAEQQNLRDWAAAGQTLLAPSDTAVAPSGAISIASVAATGALTGTFWYNVTFLTAIGETAPWPGSPTSTGAITAKRVELSNIPRSTDPAVIARKIYRTDGTTTEPREIQYLATINDNTTTTYSDNDASASGVFADWAASNRDVFRDVSGAAVAHFSDQATSFGSGTFGRGKVGYACTAFGFDALADNTSGRRNTAVGVYALENVTTSYECTAIGVHAGGGLIAAAHGCTMLGYAAGGATVDAGNYNTFVGANAGSSAQKKGANNTAVGGFALGALAGGEHSNIIALGFRAGQYATASNQLFIDPRDRTNIAGNQDAGIIYGETSATVNAQRLRLNAMVRLGGPDTPGAVTSTVANLPAATSALTGYRAYVTNASAALTAGIGTIVAGGGANVVPVFCDGTNWRIG